MSFLKKIKLAIETGTDVANDIINNKEVLASEEENQHRLSICESCPYFIKETKRCNECGCFMKLKTHLKSAKCPCGNW